MRDALSVTAMWLGLAVVVGVVCYLLGPFLTRWSGFFMAAVGVLGLVAGQLLGLGLIVLGVALWLLGHRGVAARDGLWRSPLAYRFWSRLAGGRFSPTRGRRVPIYMRRGPFG